MPGKKQFEQQVAQLDALRHASPESRTEPLRKGLASKSNFLAAKAADLIREFNLQDLIPDLLKAFNRFFEHPEKSDPQCWAKNAISRALAGFELQDADVFLRGMRHIQMEPVWGGRSDTAGTLRATCALALVQCRRLSEPDLLAHLVDLLADKDKTVRAEVVRAIDQVGSPAASLLLRLRAVLGNDEPEVMGACYSGVLHIEGVTAIPWIAGFLAMADDAAGEAALAIASTRSMEGLAVLRKNLVQTTDPWFRSVLLQAIALMRMDAAIEFLIELVQTESLDAEGAIEAILRSAASEDIIQRLKTLTSANPRLARVFAEHQQAHS
ncbi:MAG: HEAT repeat domain-containing protein [Candidatus Sulfotelmatobacter sp.]